MQIDAHVRRSALDSVIKAKMNANMMESCVATIRSMIDYYDVDRSKCCSKRLEVVARFARDVQAFIRGPHTSHDPDNVSGIPHPSNSLVRSKNESRHRDCTEQRKPVEEDAKSRVGSHQEFVHRL